MTMQLLFLYLIRVLFNADVVDVTVDFLFVVLFHFVFLYNP